MDAGPVESARRNVTKLGLCVVHALILGWSATDTAQDPSGWTMADCRKNRLRNLNTLSANENRQIERKGNLGKRVRRRILTRAWGQYRLETRQHT
jgi:hypothetical protein